jgi:hypothetical protein
MKRQQDTFVKGHVQQGESLNKPTTSIERQREQDRDESFDSDTTAIAAQVDNRTVSHGKEVDQNISMFVAPYDISEILIAQKTLSDANKMHFLDKCWRPQASYAQHLDKQQFGPKKTINVQVKWLDQRKWLAYSTHDEF